MNQISPRREFAYVIACADPKIRDEISRIYNERFGQGNYFMPTELGGVKTLISPEQESDQEYLVRKIKTAARVHPFNRIVLINHSDCGAYRLGGYAFKNKEVEENFHKKELEKAREFLRGVFPNVSLEIHYFLKADQRFAW